MTNHLIVPLACALIVASGCGTTSSQIQTPTGKIGGGIPMPTSTSPSKPSSEPGKDLFLSHQPGTGRAFALGGVAAYDACTVLPLSAVQDVGIEIDPYPLVRHDFLERDAPGDPSLAWKGIEGVSNCRWPGVKDQHIFLQIYQPPYSHDWERTSRLDFLERKGAKEASVRGMAAYTFHPHENPQEWQVTLFAEGYWVLMLMKTKQDSYRGGSPQDVVNKLVDGVVANLRRGPTGPSSFSYGGPYAEFPDPCTLFTKEDFLQTYGVADVGRVKRGRTGGDQVITDNGGKYLGRYVRITCERKAIGKTFHDNDAPGLEVEFQVFPNAEEAIQMELTACDPATAGKIFGPPLAIPTKIGDGRVCMPNYGRPNRPLVFRAGRTVVTLHNWLYADATDLNALAAKLTPIAHTIAERIKGS